jgi:hypothetical protein
MAIPQEEQLNPDRIKRLHGVYNTLKSKGDDEGLAEFTEYMKSKDSIIGFDREGSPILEAKKGGAVRMQTGGTAPTGLLGFGERHEPTMAQTTEQAGLATTAAGQPVTPTLPTGTTIQGTPKTIQTNELLTQPTDLATSTTAASTAPTTNLDVAVPSSQAASTYSAYVASNTPQANAASGTLSSQSQVGNVQGSVSQQAVATPATATLDQKASVKYQLEQLYSAMTSGASLPPWASPAVQKVTAIMAQRGLGASSMAASAITQAIMESGVPIAIEESKRYQQIQLQNLNNEQQAALQNAMTYAAMDKSNLDARMTTAVNNARAFLQMDTQNLNNKQKVVEVNQQAQVQKMLTDTAAQNASLQFNAKSENEVNEFYEELGSQISNSNKNRTAATEQFNSDQKNALTRYYASVNDSREKFNKNMAMQIDQGNAVWRREVNTANTALQNEDNRINAANLLNLTTTAQNNLWQRYRDEAAWYLTSTESAKQRAHEVAMFSQQADFKVDQYEKEQKDVLMTELGLAVLNKIFG